ncbi:hypothetical protein [Paenibacillus sp. YAF4_2]|uniref:hypothetical protein n=1 Tax=Paenibacillus sp. YAF4_2 TaxID=3233085 RepID=UPI003F954F73
MKILISYLIIVISYVILALLLGAEFEEFDYSYIIEYIIVLLLSLPSALLTRKREHRNSYLYWMGSSIIPGALFMIYAKYHNDPGLAMFSWDWGLLELFVPGLFVVMQIAFIVILIGIRDYRKQLHRKEKLH